MPVSPFSVVLTLLGSRISDVAHLLRECDQDEIDEEDSFTVMGMIAGVLGVTHAILGELARKISHSCVILIRTVYCIKCVAPADEYYAAMGNSAYRE
jgi:hypothetical protein